MNEQFAQWLTGFLEGDGTIHCVKHAQYKNPKWVSTQVKVDFSQKDPSVLNYIYNTLECGNFTYGQGTTRLAYQNKTRCIPLLEAFVRYVATEHTRQQLSKALKVLGIDVEPTIHTPTIDWVSGFWDAEGGSSLGVNSELYLKIYQKNKDILDTIRQFVKIGYILEYPNRNGELMHSWVVSGQEAHDFAQLILPRLHCDRKKQELTERTNTYTNHLKTLNWMKNNPNHPMITKVVDRMRTEG